MPITSRLDLIDDTARELAQGVLAGNLDEHAARGRMAELLLEAKVCDVVAYSKANISPQQRVDLADNLISVLADKIMDSSSSFDLAEVSTGSLCGWARMLGAKFAGWDRESTRRAGIDAITVRVSPLAAPRGHDQDVNTSEAATYHASQAFGGLSVEDTVLSEWGDSEQMSRALERAENLTGFAREPVRDRAGVAVLREVFRLPALCMPESPAERAAILEQVLSDETLARRSLVQMASMVCTEPPSLPARGETPVGELLLSLWDDFDPEHLESLMVRPARAAHMIVVDALTPMSKPSRGCLRALTRAVRATSTAKYWSVAQDGLVASFLATCTEAISRFDDTNDPGARARKTAEAAEAAARWPVLAARVAAFPGAPLGSTREQVAGRMCELLEAAREQNTEDRISARHRRGLGTTQPDADDETEECAA